MAARERDFIRLRSGDESFQRRSDFVFAGLGSLEPTDEVSDVRRERSEGRRPINRRRNVQRLPSRVPQHVLSPDKWTKYSLEFDGSEAFRGMNEHDLNKKAAHSFLETLRKRKAEDIEPAQERTDALSTKETKISFIKPRVSKDNDSLHESAKGVWKDGTFVMPEYLVGTSPRSRAKAPAVGSPKDSGVSSSSTWANVSLGHLREASEGETTSELMKEPCFKKRKGKRVYKKRKVDKDEEDVKKMDDHDEEDTGKMADQENGTGEEGKKEKGQNENKEGGIKVKKAD